jgi:thioredoxin 1
MVAAIRSAILSLVLVVLAAPSFATETDRFDTSRFEAAQREGRPILVDIRAYWCPTCKAQETIIDQLAAKPEFKELIIFAVDYDTQKEAVRAFGARMQSTLIAFRGAKEIGRSVGDTNAASIESLLRSTLE